MCIFCRIATGELPASVVYDDEFTIAFLDIQPITQGHVLVIPKNHAQSLETLSQEDACRVMQVSRIISNALRVSDLRCDGVNLFLADGATAGQEVDHVHMHVIPRYPEDGAENLFISGPKQQPNRDRLDEDARKIKEAIEKIRWLIFYQEEQ